MSFLYSLLKPLVRPLAKGRLERALKDPDWFAQAVRDMQAKPLPLAKLHRKYNFEEKKVGDTPLYLVHCRGQASGRIILYFFGGGYCMPGDSKDFEFTQDMADHTGADVWMVWYPMFPDATACDIAKSAADAYEEALKTCPAEQIYFYGNSSGGALCFAAIEFLKMYRPELPLPGRLVAHSPSLRIPPTPEEQKKMDEQDHLDAMLPAHLMDLYVSRPDLFRTGEMPFEVFASPLENSWKDYPKMLILFTEDEVFLGYMPSVEKKRDEEGLDLEIWLGKGCHCVGAAGFLPESKPSRAKIYEFLTGKSFR